MVQRRNRSSPYAVLGLASDREERMYVGGGLLTLILIIVLLVWLL
jgi:hypothetical protein